MWGLSLYICHNDTFAICIIQDDNSLLDKILIDQLFSAIVSDEVIYDLFLEGFEKDNEKKTVEIKTFTIGDVGAGVVQNKDYQMLFKTLFNTFEKITIMQN